MSVPFHDEFEVAPIDGLTCMVEVDRVYSLDWTGFSDADRSDLEVVFGELPHPDHDDSGLFWFGGDEDVPPFLRAFPEPGGLRVRGILPEADWRNWDARFQASAARLPLRSPPA